MTEVIAGPVGKPTSIIEPPQASGGAQFFADIIDSSRALEELEVEWRELALEILDAGCFTTPTFYRNWLATLSVGVACFLVAVRSDTRLMGVLPMMCARVSRGPQCVPRHDFSPADRVYLKDRYPRPIRLRQLSPVVSMPAALSRSPLLCRESDLRAVTAAIARKLAQIRTWDVLAIPVFEGPNQDAFMAGLTQAGLSPWVHELHRTYRSISSLEPFEHTVARQNSNFRKNIRRARTVAAEQGMSFSVLEGRAAVTEHLNILANVAGMSWKECETRDLTIPYSGAQKLFFETMIMDPRSDADLIPVLCVAQVPDGPVAVSLSLLHGNVLTGMLMFHNNLVPKASPGVLLLGCLIDWAAARSIIRLDLNATHPWLEKLSDTESRENNVIAFAPTARGRFFSLVSQTARLLK